MISFLVKFYAVGDANEARIGSYPPLIIVILFNDNFKKTGKGCTLKLGKQSNLKLTISTADMERRIHKKN